MCRAAGEEDGTRRWHRGASNDGLRGEVTSDRRCDRAMLWPARRVELEAVGSVGGRSGRSGRSGRRFMEVVGGWALRGSRAVGDRGALVSGSLRGRTGRRCLEEDDGGGVRRALG